jgi:hypothetical protein
MKDLGEAAGRFVLLDGRRHAMKLIARKLKTIWDRFVDSVVGSTEYI